jgi:hypothetical protein
LAGQLPHTRRQVARRLGTSPRQIRLVEQQALQKLNGLAQSRGCGPAFGAVTVVNNIIGPAELAISPSLVAFGNPAYQGYAQTSFSRLGTGLEVGSAGSLPAAFGNGSTNGSTWAIQLLAIMMLVALVGFRRVIPLAVARIRHGTLPRPRPASVEYLQHPIDELEQAPCEERQAERERERIAA